MTALHVGELDGSLFEPDGDRWMPTDFARGPWSPDALHGGPVAALVARAAERCDSSEPMHLARLTLEILRPVPVSPLSVEAVISRPGRKVQVIDVKLSSQDATVALGRALRIRLNPNAPQRLAESPRSSLQGPSSEAPPGPEEGSNPEVFGVGDTYRAFHSAGAELRFVRGKFEERGPATVWVRLNARVVPDEIPSGVQRAAAAADFGNGVSSELDFERHIFINPDLTVYLDRPPQGEWICLDARTALGAPGVGLAECELWDVHGPVGSSLQSLVVEMREDSPS